MNLEACGVDEKALLVEQKGAIPAVYRARLALKGEEAVSVHREVKIAVGVFDHPLIELLGDLRKAHAISGLIDAAALRVREHVCKRCRGTLESGGVGVRDVVCRHVEVGAGGIQSAKSRVEAHFAPPCA